MDLCTSADCPICFALMVDDFQDALTGYDQLFRRILATSLTTYRKSGRKFHLNVLLASGAEMAISSGSHASDDLRVFLYNLWREISHDQVF